MGFGGGGVLNNQGTLSISNSVISGNTTTSSGGGAANLGTLTITNSTFSGNSADVGGGVYNSGTLSITNSTFSGNSAAAGVGGGVYVNAGTATLKNTIIANSPSGGDCVGMLSGSNINNLIEDSTNACNLTNGSNGNIIGQDPNLGTLTDSPGYFPLNTDSLAIDAGDNTTCADSNTVNNQSQNGVTRPQDGDGDNSAVCDIGAYEKPPVITLDDDSPYIDYNRWLGIFDSNASDGSYRASRQGGNTYDSATLSFSGTAIRWFFVKGPQMGRAQVFIDGQSKGKFCLYSSSLQFNQSRLFGNLGPGKHTFHLRVLGESCGDGGGSYVSLDKLEVGSRVYEDTALQIRWNEWVGKRDTVAEGGTYRANKSKGPIAGLRFRGDEIEVRMLGGPGYGKMQIFIDGALKETVDLRADTLQRISRTYDSLETGDHYIVVKGWGGAAGNWVALDGFGGPIEVLPARLE